MAAMAARRLGALPAGTSGTAPPHSAPRPVPSRRDAVAAAAARSATTAGTAGVGKLLTALMGPIARRVLCEPERKRSAPPPRA